MFGISVCSGFQGYAADFCIVYQTGYLFETRLSGEKNAIFAHGCFLFLVD
jgi:hypothetical protein